jgi:hypothetical protein
MKSTNGHRLAVNEFFPPPLRPRFAGGASHPSRAEARQASATVSPNEGCKSLVRGAVGAVRVSARSSRGSERWLVC